jgi:hypothetical protein
VSRPGLHHDGDLARALVRFNAHVLGLTAGLTAGAGLGIATLVLVWHGGSNPGPLLSLLHYFFPGYEVSPGGAAIGALWAGAVGYATGSIVGRAYGPFVMRAATRQTRGENDEPGRSIVLLSPLYLGLATGALLAASLLLATNYLWFRYGHESPNLARLGHYLPGYSTDLGGSVIGAFWILLYGGIAGACVAWIYDLVVDLRHPRSA